MHFVKTLLILSSLLFILACNNTPNQPVPAKDTAAAAKPIAEPKSGPVKRMTTATLDLTKYGIANNADNVLGGLKVGDKAPDFNLVDQEGKTESLKASLKKGPVLLVFLRAEWCSYCVRHLKEFQDNIQEIHDTGKANVIAISPQKSTYMKLFHKENHLSFPILYDEDHSVMKDYKVFFHVTDKYNKYIEEAKGNRIEVFNGNTEPVMPVPATYLIDSNQIIKYVHYDPNYKKRSDLTQVMAELIK